MVGKLRRWRAFCLEMNSLRGMGSWAQAWKISAAWMGGKKGVSLVWATEGLEGGEYFWSGTALELGFDAPRQVWLSMLVKNDIVAEGVDIL